MGLFGKLFIALAVSAVWGWFADLRHGDILSFAFRVVFVVAFAAVWHIVESRRQSSRGKVKSDT